VSDEEDKEAGLIEGVGETEGNLLLSGEVPLDSVELDPKAVDLLWAAHPLHMNRAQMQVVIEAERRHRVEFLEKKKSAAQKRSKPLPAEIEALTIADLGIDLSDLK
jgi:hypothetical protein